MGSYCFKDDLANERDLSRYVIQLFTDRGYRLLHENYDHKYDLKVLHMATNIETTVELKEDKMCGTTGNVAIEFESRGKPSGVSNSLADYFLYVLHLDDVLKYVWMRTTRLRAFLFRGGYRVAVGGDDGSGTRMLLVPVKLFIEAGRVIHEQGQQTPHNSRQEIPG